MSQFFFIFDYHQEGITPLTQKKLKVKGAEKLPFFVLYGYP